MCRQILLASRRRFVRSPLQFRKGITLTEMREFTAILQSPLFAHTLCRGNTGGTCVWRSHREWKWRPWQLTRVPVQLYFLVERVFVFNLRFGLAWLLQFQDLVHWSTKFGIYVRLYILIVVVVLNRCCREFSWVAILIDSVQTSPTSFLPNTNL